MACAPSQSFRPAGSLPLQRTHEVGLALSNVGPRPYVVEDTQHLGQVWWTARLAEHWLLTALAAFDTSSALGGAALRAETAEAYRVTAATELELGFAWAAVSLPVSLRLWKGASLYTSPRFGNWGSSLTPFIPVGVSSEIFGAISVRAEVELSWADFQYYNRRVHWGFALAHQW